jgi:hypothetical protein
MKEHEDDLARIIVGLFLFITYIHVHSACTQTLENGKTLAEAKVGGNNTGKHVRFKSKILRVKMLTVPLSSR